ncbi:glutamine--fructose-6-phosphate transaminase (isomerizing) [Patescibacteria group bacterium]|nr:glutamine--fructose-6-phosphate transaminase (isomerizing) [Patescibacteria group bacterium]
MCGIVAYVGEKKATPILIDGLKRLEYRGYDSAGIAVFGKEKIECEKKKGRIRVLEDSLSVDYPEGNAGIAHTRWATHGAPSDLNAHPHWDCNKKILIVHNGIIENYIDLRKKLKKAGHAFNTETDTEILAHLIEEHLKNEKSLFEAVRKALNEVHGTYGIAVMSEEHPGEIIGAKNGSPLIIGIGDDEHFIASDVSALLPYTRRVVYPRDGEIIRITKDAFEVRSIKSKEEATSKVEKVEWSSDMATKKGYPHFMLKEIFEQPLVIRNAIAGRIIPEEGLAHLGGLNYTVKELLQVDRIMICAMGTAYYAGLVGKYMIEELLGIPVDIENASEFRYKRIILGKNTMSFVISQSGETADTIAALREIKRKGHRVLGVSNVAGSTIARDTDGGIFVHAGPEIGVASTKAFVAQIAVLVLFAVKMGRHRDMTVEQGKEITEALVKIPAQIESILEKSDEIKKIAEKYKDVEDFLYMGRKFNFPIALEGALKLKEISYIHAEGYPAGEMKHGPIALIDKTFPALFVAPKDSVYDKTINNIQEIKAREGDVLAIGSESDTELPKMVEDFIAVPETIEVLEPLLTVIPLQLLSYHLAVLRECDVDKPRNLAKSVTVE